MRITAFILAKKYESKVMGVDISERMVQRSREKARRKKVEDKVEFKIGDAQDLPFDSQIFDAVICESVVAFPKDKQKAINEFAHVTKAQGHVGMDEVTWIEPSPPELEEYLSLALGQTKFLKPEAWEHYLKKSGLKCIKAKIYKTNAISQWTSEVKQMNPRDYLGAWCQLFSLYFKRAEVRKWIKEIMVPPKSIWQLFEYFGYGLYTGRK